MHLSWNLVYSYDLDLMSDPVWGEVNPAAVAAQTHLLLEHFFSIDLEFHLHFPPTLWPLSYPFGFLLSVHLVHPRPLNK
jgi:hypothetical protein